MDIECDKKYKNILPKTHEVLIQIRISQPQHYLNFSLNHFLFFCFPVHYRIFSNIPGLHSLDASITHTHTHIPHCHDHQKSKNCQMSLRGKITSS